jgi:ABC-2 type transport system ATP-binding protein
MAIEPPAVSVRDLHKSFDDVHAVKGIDFSIARGTIFSLLGPNGAGKSTTISMIACLLKPDKGDIEVMGYPVSSEPMKVKGSIGVVPQDLAIYEDLSARENLTFWGKMYGLRGQSLKQRVDDVLGLIQLADRQKEQTKKYSGGMKRRLNIGIALLHRPEVLILDEPTVGIDPQSRRAILEGVKDFNRQGMTVLYTTHYMEEAQELSDHIAIMDRGSIVAEGTHTDLVRTVGEKDRLELRLTESNDDLMDAWRRKDGVDSLSCEEDLVTLLVDDSNRILPHLFDSANKAAIRIVSVDIREPNLETVFLHLTGHALRD